MLVAPSAHVLLGHLVDDPAISAVEALHAEGRGASPKPGRGASVVVTGWTGWRELASATRNGAGGPVVVVGFESDECAPAPTTCVGSELEFVTMPCKGGALGALVRALARARKKGAGRVGRALVVSSRGPALGSVLRGLINGEAPIAPVWTDSVRGATEWLSALEFDCVIAARRVRDGSASECLRTAAALDGVGCVELSDGAEPDRRSQTGADGCEVMSAGDLQRPGAVRETVQRAIERATTEGSRRAEHDRRLLALLLSEQEKLISAARSDALTGVPNRAVFEEMMASVAGEQGGGGERACLLLIDVDHFKQINDRYGHERGDEVLRSVAGSIVRALRDAGTPFRVGGEEFAAICEECCPARARELGERVRSEVERAVSASGIRVTVSVGVAMIGGRGDGSGAYALADAAMYHAKRGGRNQVRVAA